MPKNNINTFDADNKALECFNKISHDEDATFCLITNAAGQDGESINLRGKAAHIIAGIGAVLNYMLENADENQGLAVRNYISSVLMLDEHRRKGDAPDE